MDLRKLKTLIDLVSESNVSELEITEAEGKVRIVKAGYAAPVQTVYAPMAAPLAAPVATGAAPAVASAEVPAPAAEAVTGFVVKSPWSARSTAPPARAPRRLWKWAAK